jgi:D-alanine-D-alanine ligase
MKPSKLKVGIACNLKTEHADDAQAEFDEPSTVEAIKSALLKGGYDAFVIEATTDFPQKVKETKPDIVFNIAEGLKGRTREGQVPAILDYLGVPYTGSDATALGVALDKVMTKRLVKDANVITPGFFTINSDDFAIPVGFSFPAILKPNAEGSSKGISDKSVAKNEQELREKAKEELRLYGNDLLAESYIDGREFTVGLLGNSSSLKVFEPMELIYKKLRGDYKVYSYEVKRNFEQYISYRCPAEIPQDINRKLKEAAKTAFNVLGCKDLARVDFRLGQDGTVFFIEANPLPGLAPNYSDYPMLAQFNGVSYDELVCAVLEAALKRLNIKKS